MVLSDDRYAITFVDTDEQFQAIVEQEKQRLDCLILQHSRALHHVTNWLYGQATVLPAVILHSDAARAPMSAANQEVHDLPQPGEFWYHTAEVHVEESQLDSLSYYIDRAIDQFLNLSPNCRLGHSSPPLDAANDLTTQNFLMVQQHRLADKLKERLGYLGVYYKRNPQTFYRHLPASEKQELLHRLKSDYREVILQYFTNDGTLNQRIDEVVNLAFFSDVPVSQVVETHMEIMDEFSKQLKLEGRNEDVLLDYRLTLIDTLAHLCEMYRRSIPRES